MKINIKGTNFKITPEVTNYLEKRIIGIEKFLPKDERAFVIDVELGKTTEHHHAGDIFKAEININFEGQTFRAVSIMPDLYSAIDDMKTEINRELGSFKEKKISLLRRGGQRIKNLLRCLYKKSGGK